MMRIVHALLTLMALSVSLTPLAVAASAPEAEAEACLLVTTLVAANYSGTVATRLVSYDGCVYTGLFVLMGCAGFPPFNCSYRGAGTN